MKKSLLVLAVFVSVIGIALEGRPHGQAAASSPEQDHISWVSDSLKRMQTVQPGMTRADLLKVFTTEGGINTRNNRKYVSRDCLYFKVDVEFHASSPGFDEAADDVIVKISRPYLEFQVIN